MRSLLIPNATPDVEKLTDSATFRHYILLSSLYRLACDYDGVDRSSSYVVFSAGNPWTRKIDALDYKGTDVLTLGLCR